MSPATVQAEGPNTPRQVRYIYVFKTIETEEVERTIPTAIWLSNAKDNES